MAKWWNITRQMSAFHIQHPLSELEWELKKLLDKWNIFQGKKQESSCFLGGKYLWNTVGIMKIMWRAYETRLFPILAFSSDTYDRIQNPILPQACSQCSMQNQISNLEIALQANITVAWIAIKKEAYSVYWQTHTNLPLSSYMTSTKIKTIVLFFVFEKEYDWSEKFPEEWMKVMVPF